MGSIWPHCKNGFSLYKSIGVFYSHMIVENLIRRYEVLSVICKSHGTGEVRPIEHIKEKKMF